MINTFQKTLNEYVIEGKWRYGQGFWMEEIVRSDGNKKLVVMTEKLAEALREKLREAKILQEVSSLEKDETVGENFEIQETVDLYTSIDNQKKLADQLVTSELVRGFVPKNFNDWMAVTVRHDFMDVAPLELGWIKQNQSIIPSNKTTRERPDKMLPIEEVAKDFLGLPYCLGGKTRETGYDCSSFAQTITWLTKGVWLPRISRWQAMVGNPVELKDLMAGDLAFFTEGGKNISHVGLIYETRDEKMPIMVHAPQVRGKVVFEDLEKTNWFWDNHKLIGFRRI